MKQLLGTIGCTPVHRICFCWTTLLAVACTGQDYDGGGEVSAELPGPAGTREDDQQLSVENGRLTFRDKTQLAATLRKLSKFSKSAIEAWEKSLPGFESLRSNAAPATEREGELPALPLAVRSILNKNGQYKLGADIYYLSGRDEYIIPNGDETVLAKLVAGSEVDFGQTPGLVHHELKVRNLPRAAIQTSDEPQTLAFQETPLDDNEFYECKFRYNDVDFRFKYLARAWSYINFIYVDVFSFFEYYQSRRWRSSIWTHAGNPSDKSLRGLNFWGSATWPGGPFNYTYGDIYQPYSTEDIHIAEPFVTDELYISVSGEFSSSVLLGVETFNCAVNGRWTMHETVF
jgi:hypothetical protein